MKSVPAASMKMKPARRRREVLLEIAQAQLPDGHALTMMVRVKDENGMIVAESSLEMHTI